MILLEEKSTNKHIFALEGEGGVVTDLARVQPAKRHKRRSYTPKETTIKNNEAEKARVISERQALLDQGYKNIGAGTFEGTIHKPEGDWRFFVKGTQGRVTIERVHLLEIIEGICDGMITIEDRMEFSGIWSYYYHGAELFVTPVKV